MSAKNYEVTGITVHHSQRNQLESSLHDSKNRMDESNVRADVAQNEVVQIKNHLDQVQINYDHQQDVSESSISVCLCFFDGTATAVIR